MLDGTPDYSSPSHAGLHPAVMVNHPQQLTGLGILHGGMEMPLNRLRSCPTSQSMQLPSDSWGGQIIPGQSFSDAALNAGGFPTATSYEQYNSRPPVSSSQFGFSNFATHGMSAPLCYSPNIAIGGSNNTFYDQFSGAWPVTPRSQTSTPTGNSARLKEEIDRAWDVSVPPRPPFPDARGETPVHEMAQLSRATLNNALFAAQISNGHGGERFIELDPNIGSPIERERRDSAQASSIGSPKSDKTSARTSRRQKSPVTNGLKCTVCGYLFTRRSNCREHMKKHDPNLKRDYGCEICGRSFGRRTDLKRHVDSVSRTSSVFGWEAANRKCQIHHGTRRFGCEQCGRRFTRQDTLTR